MLATLLPLYHFADKIVGQEVLIETDNMAVVWAFQKGRCKGDAWASLILEAIMYTANTLPFQLYVLHRNRRSNLPAKLADDLSRSDSKGLRVTTHFNIPEDSGWPPSIITWMETPRMDCSLPHDLLQDFKEKLHTVN